MNAKHYYLSVLLLLVATLGLRAQSKTVTLTEAGTLENFVSAAEQTSLTDLTVKGPINSADILFIRGMAGNLKVLNLLDANIVYSEESYYSKSGTVYHTQNDVVGDYMFYGMTTLTKITLPKGVWSIGTWNQDDPWNAEKTNVSGSPSATGYSYESSALARCVNLQEVVLPAGLLWIGPHTFDYCSKLTTVNLPEGLEGIGGYAFSECRELVNITLPASLGTPVKLDFYEIRDEKYFIGNAYYGVFSNCVNLSEVTFSAGLKGLPEHMFSGCSSLENVELPDGLKYINSAFAFCVNLKSLSIPATVIDLGSFEGCRSLTELTLPDAVGKLDDRAFAECSGLTSIKLPAYIDNIPSYAFQNCTALTSIVIPDKVNGINNNAFSGCTALKSITFSNEINIINPNAFYGCTALENVELPSKLLTLGEYSFYDCTGLKTITIPQSLSEIGQYAFKGCTQLTAVKLPSVLMNIRRNTFEDCENLATAELPVGLLTIDEYAFSGCMALTKITIPSGVRTISQGAFRDCGLKEVILSEGLTTLAPNSFSGCKSLEKVVFPSTIETVGGFNGSGVKTVSFAEGAAPTAMNESAFAQCENLQSIVLPNSIKTIGYSAFNGCKSLQSVTLPASITKIPNNMFCDCSNLLSLEIPEGVTEIEYDAFVRCYKLASVSLPSTLTKIGSSAFYNSGIESITIPEGVTTIYGSTFYNCDSLTTVKLPASLARITRIYDDNSTNSGSSPFNSCNRLADLDLSKSKISELPEEAFTGLPIRTLDLSAATLTTIPSRLCSSCDSLRTIKLPDAITMIGEYAFNYCPNLTVTALPASLTTISNSAFNNIKAMTASWPAKLTNIGSNAFYNVTFNDLTIPENITTINDYAFSNAEVKGTLTINPAANLSLGNSSFICSGSKSGTSGNLYYYHLGTVNWNSTTTFPKDKFCQIDNLYLPEGGNTSSKQDIGYIFYNGITDSIAVASAYNNGRYYYEVKQPMKTRKVTYTKRFSVTSGFNEAAGWKTLVLPFTVTKITHTRGYGESQETVTLAPFGNAALETEGVLPFWLYELGTDGNYKAATTIEANKAYLISMPNNDAYPSENNISGDVVFMAEDATNGITLGVTEGALSPSTGTKFDLVPTYEQVTRGLNVYTLNEDSYYYADDKTYPNGSVFVQDYEDVYPFQAYLVSKEAQAGTLNAVRYYAIGGGDGTITGIEDGPAMPDQATRAYSRGGVLYIQTNADRTIYIYNVQGQTVRIVNAHEGLNEVRGLEEGIYMLEGQKVVVK